MDTLANLLTSIRNAEMARRSTVSVPTFKMGKAVLEVLRQGGYINSFEEEGKALRIGLGPVGTVHHYRRLSKPGRRLYAGAKNIPSVLGGRGLVILSTPQGVLSGQEARKRSVGGELICEVY